MDEIETKPVTQSTQLSEAPDLRAQYESLRHLIVSVLILLIVVSGTFNIYLLRQFRYAGKDLEGFKPYAQETMMNYQKGDGPAVENFLGRIVDYGRTHPDFAPILKKYRINPGPATGGAPMALPPPGSTPKASGPAAPALAPASAPKK
jgi:hypothetical protein